MKNFIKPLLIGLTIISSAAVVQSCTEGNATNTTIPKTAEAIPVKIIQLERSLDKVTIKASGQLTTDDETMLAFKTGGIISAVLVKEGDQVKKGQVLATLDLTEINALVAQARHGFEKAQRDFSRVTNLYKDSVATLEQMQNAETGLAVAREQLEAATFNKSFSQIHAQADGYVLRKFANAGQIVGPGDPVLQTNGAIEGKWVLKIGVSDKQWASVKIGNTASVKADAFPEKEFEAVVTRKSETADRLTGAFTIELQIKDREAKFASGMFGTAEIVSEEAQPSWSVPFEAVLDANDNEGFVFVTNDNKTAIRKSVIIESFDENSIRVSKGLEDATSLIISGSAYLSDKSPITVLK